MKFCYIDESGKGSKPVLVLAGIIADAHRMHVTKSDWLGILQKLSNDYQREIRRRKASIPNPDPPLNMIVDVPYFADSRHVGMLQIADLFSYLLRHHAELQAGYTTPEYADEMDKVSSWVSRLATLLVPDNFRWKASGGCECNKFFRSIAPEPLIEIHRRPPQATLVVPPPSI